MQNNTHKWHKCKKHGTQLRLEEENQDFTRTANHFPIQVIKYSKNQVHYSHPPIEEQKLTKPMYQPYTRWNMLISQQPQWMQELIRYATFSRIDNLTTATNESNHMIIVLDGSGEDFKLIFGWIMCTPGRERLARCAGHYHGRENYL